MDIQTILSNSSYILIAVAIICTLVTVITEFTKEIGIFKKIPTILQVLITSMIMCIVSFFMFTSYMKIGFKWYYLVAVIFAGFLIAILCAKGWSHLINIWKKFYKGKEQGK